MCTFICIIAYGLSFVTIIFDIFSRNPLILLNLSVILISQLEGIFIFLLLKRNNKIYFTTSLWLQPSPVYQNAYV